jgi:ribosomal protein S2
MPDTAAQLGFAMQGTPRALVVRWMLGGSLNFEEARERYRPFNRLVDEAPATRAEIADAAINAAVANVPVYVIANNKAEGSAPLTLAALARAIVDRKGRSVG